METKLVNEILELATYFAHELETNGYKNLAGSIRSMKSKYNKKYKDKMDNKDTEEQMIIDARKLLANTLQYTYDFFHFQEDLLKTPLTFFNELSIDDGIFYIDGEKFSIKDLKLNNDATIIDLNDIKNYALEKKYLDETTWKGWD